MTWPVTQRGLLLVIIDKLRDTALRALNSDLPYKYRKHMHDYLTETRRKMEIEVDAVPRTAPAEEADAMFYANLCGLHGAISVTTAASLWEGWHQQADRVAWLMEVSRADPLQ